VTGDNEISIYFNSNFGNCLKYPRSYYISYCTGILSLQISSANRTDSNDIIEILLKVAFNNITLTLENIIQTSQDRIN